jgi:hypothetical protein
MILQYLHYILVKPKIKGEKADCDSKRNNEPSHFPKIDKDIIIWYYLLDNNITNKERHVW